MGVVVNTIGFRVFLFSACFIGLIGLAASAAQDDASYTGAREKMVRTQIEQRGIEDKAVLEAMSTVARHRFVPADYRKRAYRDSPLPIGHGQTISQPYIVAAMTELVRPDATMKVLEIGTGSGYQAAVLAQLVDQVYTIEIVEPLAQGARRLLQQEGYDNISIKQGDGYFGWEQHAPYDAIVVTAAAQYIPPPLLEQLKPGGRMIIPVGSPFFVQRLMLVAKDADGDISSRSVMSVRFVPFTRE